MPRRRNHLSASQTRLVAWIAALSGVLAAFAGCRPVNTPMIDPLMTALVAGVVTWAAATAPWWALAVAAGGLALAEPASWRLPLALAACVTMLVIGAKRISWAPARALAGAACVQIALRLDIPEPFGRSALVGGAAIGLIFVTGVLRREPPTRRRVTIVAAGLGAAAGIAILGAATGALAARDNLERGVDAANDGLAALRAGDPELASLRLSEAAAALDDARRAVDAPWMWPARAVPVVSQHMAAASSLVDAAHDAAVTVSDAVVAVDLDAVRVRGGQVDLAALAALSEPLRASVEAVRTLDAAVADSRSGWLVDPLSSLLGDLADETAAATEQANNALEVTELAPRLLGRDGPRVWFIMFTTPAEARGLGGFPGNFAELTVDDGFISVTRFGRATDLINGGANPDGRTISGPADYVARYGSIGAGGNGVPIKRLFWNNVTLSPDLPSVAQVVAELYPQSGGQAIDGIIVADPIALQALVSITGPLTVAGRDAPLTATDTANFLLREQYTVFPGQNNERKDALESVALQATQALLTGDLPSPATIARALGGPSRTGHLMIWSLHEEDQAPLRRLGVSGEMALPDSDGFAFTVNNSGPNKLDAYLTRSMAYEAVVDEATGEVFATATIRFRNTLPTPITLPPDVISNEKGLPPGTNRMWLSIYSPLRLSTSAVDGRPQAFTQATELGWNVFTTYLNIAPGQDVTVTLDLGGILDVKSGYSLLIRPQPLAVTNPVSINIANTHGERLVDYVSSLDVVTTLPDLT